MKAITLGTFDLPHIGHLRLINRFYLLVDSLTVVLNSDEFVMNYKGQKPIMTYEERRRFLLEVFSINVIKNTQKKIGDSCKKLLIKEKPDLIFVGSDWARKDYLSQIGVSQDWLDKNGISVCYVPYTKGISTTILKERI